MVCLSLMQNFPTIERVPLFEYGFDACSIKVGYEGEETTRGVQSILRQFSGPRIRNWLYEFAGCIYWRLIPSAKLLQMLQAGACIARYCYG